MKTCIRYLAVVFAVAMMVCALSSVSAAFPDVKSDNPHINAIESMTNLGIIGGYEDGNFVPDGLVRRDEMAKIIFVTYTTYTDAGEGSVVFPDVSEKSWAKGYISWCASKNIVGGYEDGTFRPEGNITYDEALKMVCTMLGYTDFTCEMWPIDVRTKGLIDLKLGEGLENVAGDAALTRAQVVQLVYNSLDKPMYTEPVESEFGIIGLNPGEANLTLSKDIWALTEIAAQVIGTEHYGLIDAEKNIAGTKTDDEGKIQVRLNFGEGIPTEDVMIELTDIGLDSYIGKSDSLIALNINLTALGEKDNYVSANLKGIRKEGVTGGYASTEGLSDDEKGPFDSSNYDQGFWAKKGMRIDGKDHYNEKFEAIRRLTYYDDTVVSSNAFLNSSGEVVNEMKVEYSNGDRDRSNMAFVFTQGAKRYAAAIDYDADGWYDYVIYEHHELYRVKRVTSKQIEFEWLYISFDPDYEQVPGMDLVFPKENVTMLSQLEEGDIVLGYPMGDFFTVVAEPTVDIGYVTSYAGLNSESNSYTLNTGITLSGAYVSWAIWDSHRYRATLFSSFNATLDPVIGMNAVTGDYNYIKIWSFDGKIAWLEHSSADEASGVEGHNKAILLYVTEPTPSQLNEKTKQHEVYYPAYLVINGRTQLVNLNATYAIDQFSGETISQDGSKYRARIENDEGQPRVMYANELVTYSIDNNGYYTLYTNAEDLVDTKTSEIIEKVIQVSDDREDPAYGKYEIDIDSETGIATIFKDDVALLGGVVVDDDTVIYYPYTKQATGKHEYIDYYKGSEIPADFGETEIKSDIYLRYDEENEFWILGTVMLKGKLNDAPQYSTSYTEDARQHLFAVAGVEAILENDEVYASYAFKNLHTYEDVTHVNKSQTWSAAEKTEKGKIYAWDKDTKNYVEITTRDHPDSFKSDAITKVLANRGIIATRFNFADGVAIDETVKIIAITDSAKAETRELTIEDLAQLMTNIEKYNEENEETVGFSPKALGATIGVYKENSEPKVAYIIVDWFEYDEALEAYTNAGVEVE